MKYGAGEGVSCTTQLSSVPILKRNHFKGLYIYFSVWASVIMLDMLNSLHQMKQDYYERIHPQECIVNNNDHKKYYNI